MTPRAGVAGDANSGDAGFTLVETVVAFAILALVVSTALQIVGQGGARIRDAAKRAAALELARSELAILDAGRRLRPGQTAGRFDDRFAWTLTAEPHAAAAGESAGLVPWTVRIDVAATGQAGIEARLRTILLARPAEP